MAGRPEVLTLERDCPAVTIPAGRPLVLGAGCAVAVVQTLGGSVTVRTPSGLARIEADAAAEAGLAAALGLDPERAVTVRPGEFSMDLVVEALHTVYDPEIPIDVVELGLVYRCEEHVDDDGRRRVEVDMSMTAPGCGMGDVLRGDVERVVGALPGVDRVEVTLVWDPPWSFDRLSDEARLRLGLL